MPGFALDGTLLLTSEGRVVVARAPSAPFAERWRRSLDAAVIGLAIGPDTAVALDASGAVTVLDLGSGETRRALDVGAGASALAASSDGAIAAAGPAGLVLESAGELTPMDLRGATALALYGGRLCIGTREGAVRLLDVGAARSVGACPVGGPVRAVAWSPRGPWIAAIPHAIVRIGRNGDEAFAVVDAKELELGPLACDAEGAFAAVRVGARKVAVFDLLEGKLRGTASYEADVSGVAFGADGALGIGFGDGDFDMIDLVRGEGRPGKATQLRVKQDEVAAVRERVQRGETPPPELARRPAVGAAPTPTRGAILAMIAFALLTITLLYLLRS